MIFFYFGRRALYTIMNCKPLGNMLTDTSLRATDLNLKREEREGLNAVFW